MMYTCYKQVVSAYEFELHAGVKTRHPNNHIYLENGKPIYSIIQELKTATLSTLDDVVKAVAGSAVNEEYFKAWKGKSTISTYQPDYDGYITLVVSIRLDKHNFYI